MKEQPAAGGFAQSRFQDGRKPLSGGLKTVFSIAQSRLQLCSKPSSALTTATFSQSAGYKLKTKRLKQEEI